MKTLFISATNTNIGKTYTARLLGEYCNQKGIKTIVTKPIETGDTDGVLLDCHIHLEQAKKVMPSLNLEDINFYRYVLPASPFVAQIYEPQAPKIDFEHIRQKITALQAQCDFLIIEGAGGIMVPIDGQRTMLDLALYLDSHLLLVSSDRLGMINDLLLNREVLCAKNIPCTYVVNVSEYQTYEKITKPYIDYLNTFCEQYIHTLQNDMATIIAEIFSVCGVKTDTISDPRI